MVLYKETRKEVIIMMDFLSNYELYFKIILSSIIGFFIGWDRTSKNKPAGLKTYMYVAVSTTLITVVSIESVTKFSDLHSSVRMDLMRLAAQIVSGLGFLGAGVILKDGLKVKGLTSAAMVFFVGGIGIAIGSGFYGIVICTVIVTSVLAKLANYFREHEIGTPKHKIKDKEE